jgi:hypothetical protein
MDFGKTVNNDFGKTVQTPKVPNLSNLIEKKTGMPQFESQILSNKALPPRSIIRGPALNPLRTSFSDIHNPLRTSFNDIHKIFPARQDSKDSKEGSQPYLGLMRTENRARPHTRTETRDLTKFTPLNSLRDYQTQETIVPHQTASRRTTEPTSHEGRLTDRPHTRTDRAILAPKSNPPISTHIPLDTSSYHSRV